MRTTVVLPRTPGRRGWPGSKNLPQKIEKRSTALLPLYSYSRFKAATRFSILHATDPSLYLSFYHTHLGAEVHQHCLVARSCPRGIQIRRTFLRVPLVDETGFCGAKNAEAGVRLEPKIKGGKGVRMRYFFFRFSELVCVIRVE